MKFRKHLASPTSRPLDTRQLAQTIGAGVIAPQNILLIRGIIIQGAPAPQG